jgi:hypothetical protein
MQASNLFHGYGQYKAVGGEFTLPTLSTWIGRFFHQGLYEEML